MWKLLLSALLSCLFLFPFANPAWRNERTTTETLTAYIRTDHLPPEDYVISKFKDHDVVFLGEFHRIRHDVEFVQNLIPRLYQAGVFTLAIEFARREDQPLIDQLLNGATYDESLARQIAFNQYVFWGYQEYVDIYKAAWKLNQQLPKNKRRFRILGVNCSPDWSLVQKQEDLENNPEVMTKVWRGCGETQWGKVILDEVVAKGEKALVYSGMHHAFTQYRQPLYNTATHGFAGFGDVRMGNYVYNAIGKRAITICLHAVWISSEGYDAPDVYAADGYIDAAMAKVAPAITRVGFDTIGTPFGDLPGTTSIYKYGYKDFVLSTFCDGYIYQGPLSAYEGVTPIKDFINEANLATAQAQAPNPKFRHASAEEFNRAIAADTDMQRRLAPLLH